MMNLNLNQIWKQNLTGNMESQNPSIEGIRCQMKQLHTMLKMQLSEYEKILLCWKSILQTHMAFVEAMCVLKDSMVDVFGDKAKPTQETKRSFYTCLYMW